MAKSAIVSAAREVAVFAPGHLGELSGIVSSDLVDAALSETLPVTWAMRCDPRSRRRVRLLPPRVVVYFTLAWVLFADAGYGRVWRKLCAGAPLLGTPTSAAFSRARARLGPAPLAALFELLAGPVAGPGTAGACWRGLRLVAVDGAQLRAPDSAANNAVLAKRSLRNGAAGFPLVQLATLVECGTRALIGAAFGTFAVSEVDYARGLLPRLRSGMLLLADRNFGGNAFLQATAATGAEFLVRLKANRTVPVLRRHRDGSFTTRLAGIEVRIVQAQVTVTLADGTVRTGAYRLATTLTDPVAFPAEALMCCYHERWEIETAYLEIKSTILGGHVLRSTDPAGVDQEVWALLVVYQALRTAIADTAIATGHDPDRLSFTIALDTARDQLVRSRTAVDGAAIATGPIGTALTDAPLPLRRLRIGPRSVKRPISRYAYIDLNVPKTTWKATIEVTIQIAPDP